MALMSNLIKIYKKNIAFFQGKPFSAVILFYKESRVFDNKLAALGSVLKHWCDIKVYGGKKSIAIKKVLENAKFDDEGCNNFVYTWDPYKTVKLKGKILGNCTLDYKKVVDFPLKNFLMEGDTEFIKSNNEVLYAIKEYIERLNLYVANSQINNREKISLYLGRMWEYSAESLEEALQRILVMNQIEWQTGHTLVGLARMDYILDRFSKEENKNEEALFHEFCHLIHKYYVFKSNTMMGDTGQIFILGGTNEDGSYFYNKYTELIMKVVGNLNLPDPKVLLRVNKNTPESLWNQVSLFMANGQGSPLISNDDQVISNMLKFGYDKKDACNYITSACWEPVPGEGFEQNNIISLNYLKPFDMISSTYDLDKITSFDVLYKLYKEELKKYIKECEKELSAIKWEEDPLLSMFCDKARERQMDVAIGGSGYNNYGILTLAMSNTVNSFYNIQKYVFDEKRFSYKEFDAIRKNNYSGKEDTYALLHNSVKVFGSDEKYAIDMVNDLTKYTEDVLSEYTNPLGGKVKFGLSSPHYIRYSADYPASFDGRRKGEPFGVHISASGGVAYTEIMNFASELDYSGARFNGNVVDFLVSPSLIKNNIEKFTTLLKVSIENGVYQMQANIIDSKTLIAAKKSPKDFPNLIVRVWGFNSYFNELPEEYKDYLIERAIQSETASC